MSSREPVIIDAVRTPIGKREGAFKDVRPDDLGSIALNALLDRTKIDPDLIEDLVIGCVTQRGEQGGNVALLYEENARHHRFTVELRHKLALRYFLAAFTLAVISAWLMETKCVDLRDYLWLPCKLAAVLSIIFFFMEKRNVYRVTIPPGFRGELPLIVPGSN